MLTEKSVGKTVPFTTRLFRWLAQFSLGLVMLAVFTGCESDSSEFQAPTSPAQHSLRPVTPEVAAAMGDTTTNNPTTYVLREGDIVKISFPGSPNLNSVQSIRTDGKISLQLVG